MFLIGPLGIAAMGIGGDLLSTIVGGALGPKPPSAAPTIGGGQQQQNPNQPQIAQLQAQQAQQAQQQRQMQSQMLMQLIQALMAQSQGPQQPPPEKPAIGGSAFQGGLRVPEATQQMPPINPFKRGFIMGPGS